MVQTERKLRVRSRRGRCLLGAVRCKVSSPQVNPGSYSIGRAL